MKKFVLILLCLSVFAMAVGGYGAYLYMTPRGVLRPDGPDQVMQSLLDERDRSAWRDEYVRLCPPAVTPFEDAAKVAADLFDAGAEGAFTFRPVPGTDTERQQDYIVSAGNTDLFLAHLTYDGQRWNADLQGMDALRGSVRTLTVTAPEGTRLTLNGRAVGPEYITDDDVLYPDMTALEMRFDSWPHLVRYTIEGIYEDAELTAQRDGGLVELYSDGSEWRYTVPDAGGYAFAVTAPGEAVVTVNGAQLHAGDTSAVSSYVTKLAIPDELQGVLPSYSIYAAGGLYTPVREIRAVMPDGTELTGEEQPDGSVSFPLPGSQALYEACHGRVEEFLKALCEYGAGHTARAYPGAYTVAGSELLKYLQNATASLYWTAGVTTSYQEISSSDYLPLGDEAFICRGHVLCTTKTKHQTVDLDMRYEMLWIRSGNNWQVQDLAFL